MHRSLKYESKKHFRQSDIRLSKQVATASKRSTGISLTSLKCASCAKYLGNCFCVLKAWPIEGWVEGASGLAGIDKGWVNGVRGWKGWVEEDSGWVEGTFTNKVWVTGGWIDKGWRWVEGTLADKG